MKISKEVIDKISNEHIEQKLKYEIRNQVRKLLAELPEYLKSPKFQKLIRNKFIKTVSHQIGEYGIYDFLGRDAEKKFQKHIEKTILAGFKP